MKTSNYAVKSLFGIVIFVMLVGVWVAPAAAAGPDEQAQRDHARLEYGLKWMLIRVDALQDRLDNAGEAADLVAEVIADEQQAGHDTTILEDALADYRSSLDAAQDAHDRAAQILSDKAGFNDDGTVEDPQQARDTLKSARETIREARETMREGRKDLREAMREYRQNRRDNK